MGLTNLHFSLCTNLSASQEVAAHKAKMPLDNMEGAETIRGLLVPVALTSQ